MTFFEIGLEDDELAAVRAFIASQPEKMTEAWALRLLIRDALIGMGDLESPGQTEARRAAAH